jgi:uncharacterized protein (DUF433 family)
MSDAVIIPINYIERKANSDQYRIVGKGVTVEFLSRLIDDPQWSVERICANYGLTPAEVHAAWAFYYDHQAEIDQRVDADAVQQIAAAEGDTARRDRVQQRYQAKTGLPYPALDDQETL